MCSWEKMITNKLKEVEVWNSPAWNHDFSTQTACKLTSILEEAIASKETLIV